MALNGRGHEVVDDKPVALPVGYRRPPTLQEQIRALVRGELSARAQAQGQETFEEADDFEVGDDFDPKSPYEQNFDQEMAQVPGMKEGMQEQVAMVPKDYETEKRAFKEGKNVPNLPLGKEVSASVPPKLDAPEARNSKTE